MNDERKRDSSAFAISANEESLIAYLQIGIVVRAKDSDRFKVLVNPLHQSLAVVAPKHLSPEFRCFGISDENQSRVRFTQLANCAPFSLSIKKAVYPCFFPERIG